MPNNMLNFPLCDTIKSNSKYNHLPISTMKIMARKWYMETSYNFTKDSSRANL